MSRRALLAASLALACCYPAGQQLAGAAGGGDCLATVGGVNLLTATVPQLARALATGSVTSRSLTTAYLRRIRAFDHGAVKINAVRKLTSDALKQADASDARRRRHRT